MATVSLESLECPICFEIPDAEVYQCKDGHIICSKCFSKVKMCPQCRISLRGKKIRNRIIESIIETAPIPCKFRDDGCTEIKIKKDMPTHVKSCKYKFRSRTLCKLLGYKCDYVTSIFELKDALDHFKNKHGIIIQDNSYANLSLENFEKITGASNMRWSPVVLQAKENGPKFLIAVQIDGKHKGLWMGCHLFEDPLTESSSSYEIKFTIKSESSEFSDIEWNIKTSSFFARYGGWFQCPLFKVPMAHLKQYFMSEGTLSMSAKVSNGQLEADDPEQIAMEPVCLLPMKKCTDFPRVISGTCFDCKSDISGDIAYSCLQCLRLTCQDCMTKGTHLNHIHALLKGVFQQKYIQICCFNEKCDWTNALHRNDDDQMGIANDEMEPIFMKCFLCSGFLLGVFYPCLLCPDRVNICQECVDKDLHRCHILGVIVNLEQYRFWNLNRQYGSNLLPLFASEVDLS